MLQKCSLKTHHISANNLLPKKGLIKLFVLSFCSFLNRTNFGKFTVLFFLFFGFNFFAQQTSKSKLLPYKVGILYNHANEKNFLFDNTDYSYQANLYKAQFFYKLGNWRTLDFELIVLPQIQFLRHQLINEFFVQPRYGDHYLELRKIYTKRKAMNLYALELGVGIKKQLVKNLDTQFTFGLGFAYINTTTERLAKGFTFIENFSLGLNYKISADTFVYLGGNFGHVSNLNFQFPNDGYNVLGLEVGFSFMLP